MIESSLMARQSVVYLDFLGFGVLDKEKLTGSSLNFEVTLKFQINARVQINVRAGKFAINNKHTGPNIHTGWEIYQ